MALGLVRRMRSRAGSSRLAALQIEDALAGHLGPTTQEAANMGARCDGV